MKQIPMKSSWIQQGLNSSYGAQTDRVGLFYLSDIFIGTAVYWFQLLLHLQCFMSLDVSFLLKSLEHLRQLAFLLSLGLGFFYLLELG